MSPGHRSRNRADLAACVALLAGVLLLHLPVLLSEVLYDSDFHGLFRAAAAGPEGSPERGLPLWTTLVGNRQALVASPFSQAL